MRNELLQFVIMRVWILKMTDNVFCVIIDVFKKISNSDNNNFQYVVIIIHAVSEVT